MEAQPEPRVVTLAQFALGGLSVDCKMTDISGIAPLWEKFFPFMKQHFMDAPIAWGACLPNGDPDGFKYICGCPFAGEVAPEGLELIQVPECKYVVHPYNGLPTDMNKHWTGIYKEMCERAGLEFKPDGPWLEEYPCDCYDAATGKITCDLYTPVK